MKYSVAYGNEALLFFNQTYRLRHAASRAAASSLAISGQSLPLAESRDAARTLKACLAHESGIIQRGAAEVSWLILVSPSLRLHLINSAYLVSSMRVMYCKI